MKLRHADGTQLSGAHVLVVEDEILLLMELESVLRGAGAEMVYLCRNVNDALACAKSRKLTLAILDVRLGRQSIAPVVRLLADEGTPFMFYTGQIVTDPMFAEWPGCKIVAKPAPSRTLVQALAQLTANPPARC